MEANVVIAITRDAYCISDARPTITVSEVCDALKDYDYDEMVYISHDNGYTYGPINENDMRVEEDDDEVEVLVIEAIRDGYSPSQCGNSLTVEELLTILENDYDPNMEMMFSNDNGYTYSRIRTNAFREETEED